MQVLQELQVLQVLPGLQVLLQGLPDLQERPVLQVQVLQVRPVLQVLLQVLLPVSVLQLSERSQQMKLSLRERGK